MLNIWQTIRLFCGGPGSGRHKETYTVNKGVPWETVSGYATKTGSKEGTLALQKVQYFARVNSMNKINEEESRASSLGYGRTMHRITYADGHGNTLEVSHDVDKHTVHAHLDADGHLHDKLQSVISAKPRAFGRMQYEQAARDWANDPRRRAVLGRAKGL